MFQLVQSFKTNTQKIMDLTTNATTALQSFPFPANLKNSNQPPKILPLLNGTWVLANNTFIRSNLLHDQKYFAGRQLRSLSDGNGGRVKLSVYHTPLQV